MYVYNVGVLRKSIEMTEYWISFESVAAAKD